MNKINESLEHLLGFEKKYCTSSKLANSQIVYWQYKILGNRSLKDHIPEIDEWMHHYEQFLNDGGDPYLLKQGGSFLGQEF
ncbi:hypothetical protein Desor_1743 [Desulfosporosinus orientis DSM 765]|uniref:Uncharacterized protein n=1 Tax=Desulfosporosinus orientis (strain ATCC 19365 / DSM 765 / NCIMB 8382 / VKM B-1628 / Singapore I) TaxID=768706 RepID=G7W606_DESOD|nr:hypothetical protein [Desulfosporosinus orientis]AET67382.1 hypothetical protein Desor_1743 [Desulfosporosinus orientis DSM 765]